jgi:hypothetical protein
LNNNERQMDELSKKSANLSRTEEEQRITFHRLVKKARRKGELEEITAQVDHGASKPSGASGVYFTLSRLEREGFISSEYIRATDTEKAKVFFKLTEAGERVPAKTLAIAPYEF